MLGFTSAASLIAEIELVDKIHMGQFRLELRPLEYSCHIAAQAEAVSDALHLNEHSATELSKVVPIHPFQEQPFKHLVRPC